MAKNHKKKSKIILLLFALCVAACFVACGPEKELQEMQKSDGTLVFRYGNELVTKGELCIYIETVRERYEMQYGADVWQVALPEDGGSTVSMENLTRQEVIEAIVRVKTLCAHSEDYGITLSDEEEQEIKEKAKAFCEGLTDQQMLDKEITLEKAEKVLRENVIANKVESEVLGDEKLEISDEEARVTTFYDMYFACYSLSEDGVITPYTEEERKQQYENALQACSTLATASLDEDKEAQNIEKLAEYYQLSQAKTQSLSSTDILETYGQEIYDLLYSMENEQYSTVVESEYGYHVFQMIALTDPVKTKERKVTLYQNAVQERLAQTLATWQEEIDDKFAYPDSVSMSVYDSIVNKKQE